MPGAEATVLRVLREVLPGGEDAGLDEPLGESGLSSLLATRLWFRLQQELGVELALPEVAACATGADLVERVAAAAGGAPGAASPHAPSAAADRFEPFPLTDMQQAYVIGKDPAGEDPIGCHVYRELELGDADPARVAAAWRRVVARHDMLRAVVTADGRQRVQETVPAVEVPVRDGDPADARARLSHRRYEPGEWPLWAVEITRRPDGSAVAHLSVDALLTDGHGLEVLLEDWRRWYEQQDREDPEPPVSVRDCVLALDAERRAPAYAGHLDHWRRRLAELPPGPPLRPAAGAGAAARTSLHATVDAEQWAAIRRLAERWGASPTAAVLTLFAEALCWELRRGPLTLVLTTNARGRLPAGADRVVGPFTSSMVVPLEDTLDRPLDEAVARVHRALWDDLGRAAVSGVAALRAVRSRERLGVVFTSMLGVPGREGFAPAEAHAVSQTSGVALDHQMCERGGELHVRWDAVPERFAPGALDALFARFVNALHELSEAEPEPRPLNDLQQAYYVARAAGGPAPWDGCQVCHSFLVDDLDVGRLEAAWLRLAEAHEALRTVVGRDGCLLVSPAAPRRRLIPVLAGVDAADARAALVARAFPLGRGPHSDLRVTLDGGGRAAVHVTLELTILDGRSIHLLLRELFRLYADPAAAPRRAASRPSLDEHPERAAWDAHWRARVADLPSGPLPPAGGAVDPARVRREAVVAGWGPVRDLAARSGLSTDDLLVAALTEVLARRHPVPFALPVVRWTEETEAFRPGEHTALSWLTRSDAELPVWRQAAEFARELAADARADGVSGLRALRTRVMRERRGGHFELPVVYTSRLELTGHPLPPGVRSGPWVTCTPDVALDCVSIEEGGELRLCWDAIEARFPPGELDAMFAEYRELVEGLVAGAGERRKILFDWNDTAREFPVPGPVHVLFEERARERPEAVAVRWAGGALTYGELNRRANRVAWRLRALGVGPEVAVGVSVPRGPDMVAAVLGVLKAGGFYVPVEPSLPAARAETMLAGAGASVVLVGSQRRGWDPPAGVRALAVDGADVAAATDSDPGVVATADATAYVIFTSGSTGTPKGVAVAHRPVLNLVDWCRRTHGFGPDDTGLCVTSLGFDLSVFDLLGLLGCGASVYVADEAEQKDPALLLDVLLREPITFWNSAPTSLAQLAPLFASRRGQPGSDTLRLVYLSGDYTPLTLPGEVRAAFPGARIVSLGGATEATVWSNWFEVGEIDPEWRSIPYGRPIANARYHVVDERLEPCPVGVEGDLLIGGACLSRGYHGQPELTAERFVPDPFSADPAARVYRTGDRACYFADGTICFLGRADTQVKVRGFRVELGEVEHRLRAHPAVKDAVVLARDDRSGDRRLVAYVVPAGAEPPAVADLRRHAAEALPDYMVPNAVVCVDAFPATANGKLDRDALPWPAGGAAEPSPPAPAAAELAEVFAEALGVPSVDPDVDLWDQGATSFTMVQVSAELERRHGRRIPVAALLDEPTVAGIARSLGGGEGARAGAAAAVPPAPAEPPASAPPPPPAPARPDFFSADDRDAFKRERRDLRRPREGEVAVPLGAPRPAPEHVAWRSTRREFEDGPIALDAFARLLGLLRETPGGRLYPSAGGLYAVQAYVHVRPGGVQGLEEGVYYHHPVDNALHLVNPAPTLDRSAHFVYNRPVFDGAAFALYLVGRLDAIEPLYGDDAERFLLLEAGYAGEVLMLGQAASGVGLCPVGSVALEPVRRDLRLEEQQRFLHAFLGGRSTPATSRTGERPPFAPAPQVAIVGAAARLPGAGDLDALWRQLRDGRSALGAAPAERSHEVGDAHGGFLTDPGAFDSLLFGIAPSEADRLDPQLRLLLHVVWECLENAGHTPASLGEGRVGVFLGAMWQDHRNAGVDRWRDGEPAEISATASEAANRISHVFGLDGPSVAVDTSCSSSLAALHLAVESLRRGECDAAVVAAANLLSHPYHLELLRDAGLLAPVPPGGAYDAGAAGWSPGEGAAAVLLRSPRDGDRVLAVVEGTRIGHLGGATRFGAPDAAALAESAAGALAAAGVAPDDVDYVECAAAGAAMADAAEVEALASVFRRPAEDPLPVGTVKPNVGHLEAAAGLSQLAKVLLQFEHGAIAPTLVARERTPLVAWDGLGVAPVSAARPWARPIARVLVSAVGATGSYGHAVLRAPEPAGASRAGAPPLPHVVPLSAETPAQLAALAERLRRRLAERPPALADVAFTLQTGRAQLSHRLAIVCESLEELTAALEAFARGEPDAAVATGTAPARREPPARPSSARAAADEWLRGRDVDWAALWPAGAGRRIALPTYPFADDRPAPQDTGRARDYVTRIYAELSGIPAERLDPHAPLDRYGLESRLVARLNERIERDLGAGVSKTVFFEHPDLEGVARALAARVGEREGEGTAGPPAPAAAAAAAPSAQPAAERAPGEPVAILGVAGRYPGAPDLDAFWRVLAEGRDAIGPMPGDRRRPGWPADEMLGGFVDGVDRFDPLFFGITPRDAARMDPQERLLLETAWHALEDAGVTRAALAERHRGRVGVFAATMYEEYALLGGAGGAATASGVGGLANRLSYFLDLHGPSLTVDAMCASSLTALHLAVQGLRRGECEVAIVGAVNLSLHPNKFDRLRELGMVADGGRCRSFGAAGDGFVPGEGVGAVVLRRLAAAEADGDRIRAVIRGVAVNHDGRTNGYTVPNPIAQGELVAEALHDAGLAPADVGYVEAHGTGTPLGDPIELNGLERAFGTGGRWAIGSVKSNVGHLEAAAGMAGLAKVVLQLEHGMLAPSLHAEELNPNVDWDRTPFRVQRALEPWPDDLPPRAAVSSFGAGGSNAHAIVEAAAPRAAPPSPGPHSFPVSARAPEQLREACARLARFLRERAGELALGDVAHTLHAGRERLREAVAFEAGDAAELCAKLERFAAGDATAAASDATPAPPPAGRIVSLPGYPFARMRCWVEEDPPAAAPPVPERVRLLARSWEPLPAAPPSPPRAGAILCLHAAGQEQLVSELRAALAPAELIALADGAAWGDALDRHGPVTGWLDVWSLAGDDGAWEDRLATLQETLRRRPAQGLRVLQVTSGLVGRDGPPPSLAGARLAGFVRLLSGEVPWAEATVADVEPGARVADQVAAAWSLAAPPSEVCVRGGAVLGPRLVDAPQPEAAWVPRADAAYVVTGGTRGLGALVARHLVERGARRIAVIGGSPLPPEGAPVVAELERLGATALAHGGGLGDRDALARFLDRVRSTLGPIAGVVHCAGRSSCGSPSFAHARLEDVRRVLEPKADGLDALAELTAGDDLDVLLSFSSVAGTVPSLAAGVLDYGAANAYLDLFAGWESRAGSGRCRSVAWPVWRESGGGAARPDACARAGLDALSDEEALAVLDAVLALPPEPSVVVCPPLGEEFDPAALLAPPADDPPPAPAGPPAAWLRALFSDVLGIPLDDLDPSADFADLGVESVMLAELLARIEAHVGRALEPALLLDHPTLERLAARLGAAEAQTAAEAAPPARPRGAGDRVAIVGMACRFPGAPDLDAYWRLLRDGDCAVGDVPPGRWDVERLYAPDGGTGRSVSRWGGFVDGIEDFDPDFFGMADGEARDLDPAIRLVLEGTASCLRDAGYADEELRGAQAGVFVGARMSAYRRRVPVDANASALGGDQNFIAARVSHQYDLRGPSLVVDSACSSALVALDLACQSLAGGRCDVALAGGVEVLLDEEPYLEFTAARALSPRGRCATFDSGADGFVPGEGCGVLLLKRLEDALRDGDRIRAVIDAVAVGNDGRTMGLTTPSPAAQADVVRRALDRAGVAARDVGMVEAHGTATVIGDPIELRALTSVFREQTGDSAFCAIGSAKSNVGHLLSAAGMPGIVKVVLALEHAEIPRTLFCDDPNPRFDFAASPFLPALAAAPWTAERRVAGVSAFGLGGTNAHAVLSAADGAHVPRRSPLPPPPFNRRRLWHDRPADSANGNGNGHHPPPPVASLLDLAFVAPGDPR